MRPFLVQVFPSDSQTGKGGGSSFFLSLLFLNNYLKSVSPKGSFREAKLRTPSYFRNVSSFEDS